LVAIVGFGVPDACSTTHTTHIMARVSILTGALPHSNVAPLNNPQCDVSYVQGSTIQVKYDLDRQLGIMN